MNEFEGVCFSTDCVATLEVLREPELGNAMPETTALVQRLVQGDIGSLADGSIWSQAYTELSAIVLAPEQVTGVTGVLENGYEVLAGGLTKGGSHLMQLSTFFMFLVYSVV